MNGPIHPNHAQIAHMVKNWFHAPLAEMGYKAEPRRWGTYWSNAQVYTSGFPPEQINAFLADLRQYYADGPADILIYLDDHAVERELGPILIQAGCAKDGEEVFLVHVGPAPTLAPLAGLEVAPVSEANLPELAETHLKSFADSEAELPLYRVEREIDRRRNELAGTGRGLLATLYGQPAGFIWWHEEPQDRWVNYLGVRVPFRNQGLATRLLSQCVLETYQHHLRSIILNVMTSNTKALHLYHHLGFQDEVYWRCCYIFAGEEEIQ